MSNLLLGSLLVMLNGRQLTCLHVLQRYQIPVYGSVGAVQQHAGTVGAGYPIAHPI